MLERHKFEALAFQMSAAMNVLSIDPGIWACWITLPNLRRGGTTRILKKLEKGVVADF